MNVESPSTKPTVLRALLALARASWCSFGPLRRYELDVTYSTNATNVLINLSLHHRRDERRRCFSGARMPASSSSPARAERIARNGRRLPSSRKLPARVGCRLSCRDTTSGASQSSSYLNRSRADYEMMREDVDGCKRKDVDPKHALAVYVPEAATRDARRRWAASSRGGFV